MKDTRDYSVKVAEVTKELTKVEKISIKDVSDCVRIEDAVNSSDTGFIILDVDYFAVLDVHNEKAEDKDYTSYVVVTKSGDKYLTGSKSFYNALADIYDEMEGEDFSIKVYGRPSKNYEGKMFLVCSIVA